MELEPALLGPKELKTQLDMAQELNLLSLRELIVPVVQVLWLEPPHRQLRALLVAQEAVLEQQLILT